MEAFGQPQPRLLSPNGSIVTNAVTYDARRSAEMANIRQTGIEGHRKHSSPVSPRTIKGHAQHLARSSPPDSVSKFPKTPYASGQNSVEDNTDVATPIPSSPWRPFGIFRVDLTKHVPDEEAIFEPLILRQKKLFQQLGVLCASAARKYWHNQSSSASSLPPVTHYSAISPHVHQRCQPSTKPLGGQRTQLSRANHEENPLMQYVLLINDSILRRATIAAVNHDTAFADALQLLTWAEQVGHVATTAGCAMSDEDITEALAAARALLCWLSCAEGMDEFDQSWGGMFIDGGLVLSEEVWGTENDIDFDWEYWTLRVNWALSQYMNCGLICSRVY